MDKPLCGACQGWGANPVMVGGACRECSRSESQIIEAHGVLNVSVVAAVAVRTASAMPGGARSPAANP